MIMNELKPATANQMFLAKMAGMDVATPKPVTVDQMFMQKIIDNGGTGGSGGGGSSIKVLILTATDENLTNVTANMTLTEAIEAINQSNLANVLVYAPYIDSNGLPAYMSMALWCDASSVFGVDCIFMLDQDTNSLFWTDAGISTTPPG